jgi:subfamily B ATP-binding cassette protein MsbA
VAGSREGAEGSAARSGGPQLEAGVEGRFAHSFVAAAAEPFDAALGGGPTRLVSPGAILDLLEVSHAPERVADFRRAMQGGDRFPPIAVVRLGDRFVLTDGHKRLAAVRGLAPPPGAIPVEVWPLRRWAADQAGQFRRKTRQQLALLGRSLYDAEARVAGRRLVADTMGHWRRIGHSAALRARRAAARRGVSSPTAPASRETFVRLLHECRRFPVRLTGIGLSLAALGVAQLALTWIVKIWAEGPLRSGDAAEMRRLLAAAAATTGAMMAALFVSRTLLESVNQRLVERLRNAAQGRILALQVENLRERGGGEFVSRVFNDAGALSGFVRDVLKRLIGESVVVAGALAMMLWLDPRLTLLLLAVVPLIAAVLVWTGAAIRRRSALAQERTGALTAMLAEQIQGATAIKGVQAEEREALRFARENARLRAQALHTERWSAVLVSAIWLLTGMALVAIVWAGSAQVHAGRISAGALLAFCLYAVQTVEPLRRLSEVHAMLQRALSAAARVFEVIDDPRIERPDGVSLRWPARGDVRFEAVSFAYRRDEPVLRGLDLRVAAGEAVALVAASGGGTSTIASLLVRFAAPDAGRILLDGVDVAGLALRDLRRAVCVVPQEPFVFAASLAENVRYGTPEAAPAAVRAAIERVGLEPVAAALPGGIDADLREAGRDLSGGQRQRIALARAVLRDPAVLVLDEATSALDGDAEGQLFAALEDWLARRTVIVMSHRLATVSRLPRVLVLARGRVIGDGAPGELLRGCAEFRLLFAGQAAPLGGAHPEGELLRA